MRILVGTRPQGGGALRTPKLSHGTMCFVDAGGTADFVLGIRQGECFFVRPYVSILKILRIFVENSKIAEKHKKGYVAIVPTSGPLLILPPALKRRGSPRRQGLCSHLAHLWATFASAPRSEAEGLPKAAGVM